MWKRVWNEVGSWPPLGSIVHVTLKKRKFNGYVVFKLDQNRFLLYTKQTDNIYAARTPKFYWFDRKQDSYNIRPLRENEVIANQDVKKKYVEMQKIVRNRLSQPLSYWPSDHALSMYTSSAGHNSLCIYIPREKLEYMTKTFLTIRVLPTKKFIMIKPFVGGLVECVDTVKKWYSSTIVEIKDKTKVKIHYEGWTDKWDEFIDYKENSERFRPYDPSRAVQGKSTYSDAFHKKNLVPFKNVTPFEFWTDKPLDQDV